MHRIATGRFYLKDAVDDCEECLVHFPTFKRLGQECGLKLVEHMNFVDYVHRALALSSKKGANFELLRHMRVLEGFGEGGTMTQDQWEVQTLSPKPLAPWILSPVEALGPVDAKTWILNPEP